MGRRRTRDRHLPPLMYFRRGRYFYGRNQIALGDDFREALRRYAELHAVAGPDTRFSDVAARYLKHATGHLAPKTRSEYERQLPRLVEVFGELRLDQIRPMAVRRYLTERGNTVAGTREKALLSTVFTFARESGLFDGANPCAGVRGRKARRDRYVTHDELAAVLAVADGPLRDFLELCYLTGQRPSDVLAWTRHDVRDGLLWVRQAKTGAAVRIEITGALAALIERLLAVRPGVVESVYLIRDERGGHLTLSGIRKRFWKARAAAGADWQIRDLRAKAATDVDPGSAQALLGHAAASTTDGYIRRVAGRVVSPVLRASRAIAGKD